MKKSEKIAKMRAASMKSNVELVKAEHERQAKLETSDEVTVKRLTELMIKELVQVDECIISSDMTAIESYMIEWSAAKRSGNVERESELIYPLAKMIVTSKLRFLVSGSSKSIHGHKAVKVDKLVDASGYIKYQAEHEQERVTDFYDEQVRRAYNSICACEPDDFAMDMVQECVMLIYSLWDKYQSLTDTVEVSRLSESVKPYTLESESGKRKVYAQNIRIEKVPVSKLVFRGLSEYIRKQKTPRDMASLSAEVILSQSEEGESSTGYLRVSKAQAMLIGSESVSFKDIQRVDDLIGRCFDELALNSTEAYTLAKRLEGDSLEVIACKLGKSEQAICQALKSIQKKFSESELAHSWRSLERAVERATMESVDRSQTAVKAYKLGEHGEPDQLLGEYEGVRECAKAVSALTGKRIDHSNISKVLKGKRASVQGLSFRYSPKE